MTEYILLAVLFAGYLLAEVLPPLVLPGLLYARLPWTCEEVEEHLRLSIRSSLARPRVLRSRVRRVEAVTGTVGRVTRGVLVMSMFFVGVFAA